MRSRVIPTALRASQADARRVDGGNNPAELAAMQPVSATDHARPAVPFAAATGGILLFTTVDAIVKSLPHGVPVIEVVAMCFIFAIPVTLVAVWCMGAGWPTRTSWKANVPRGVLRTGSTVLLFVALRRLPFAEVLTLGYLSPLMVALMAAFVSA